MAELDDQLRQLAAHRAESVPPADPVVARVHAQRSARRHAVALAGVAAAVVVALAVGGIAALRGSDDLPSVQSPAASTDAPTPTTGATPTTGTTATTGTTPSCSTNDGASGAAQEGPAAPGSVTAPLLVDLRVQVSDCVDDVMFRFGAGTPAWSVRYEPGPLTVEASGQPVEPAGSAWYVIRFRQATATGPDDVGDRVNVSAPFEVTGLKRLPDVDGAMVWAIGLTEQRPFRVVVDDGLLSVQFIRPSPETVTCPNPMHFAYDVPAGWFVEAQHSGSTCAIFAPQPFVMCSACDGPFPQGSISVSPLPPQPSSPESETVVSSMSTTVAGRAGTITEVAATGNGLFPADYRTYRYSVDWAPEGTLSMGIGGMPGPDFDAKKAGLDAIAASVRRID